MGIRLMARQRSLEPRIRVRPLDPQLPRKRCVEGCSTSLRTLTKSSTAEVGDVMRGFAPLPQSRGSRSNPGHSLGSRPRGGTAPIAQKSRAPDESSRSFAGIGYRWARHGVRSEWKALWLWSRSGASLCGFESRRSPSNMRKEKHGSKEDSQEV